MRTVLVVEENDLSFYLTKELLARQDTQAIRVHNISEALAILNSLEVDMVLVDAHQPENIDGIEITKRN